MSKDSRVISISPNGLKGRGEGGGVLLLGICLLVEEREEGSFVLRPGRVVLVIVGV